MINKWNTHKGDILYADLDPIKGSEQRGKRPVVVLQNNLGNKYSPTIIIAPITEVFKKTNLPTHIIIPKMNYLKYKSMVLLEQIRTIDRCRIISYLGYLDKKQIQEIDNSLINLFS